MIISMSTVYPIYNSPGRADFVRRADTLNGGVPHAFFEVKDHDFLGKTLLVLVEVAVSG